MSRNYLSIASDTNSSFENLKNGFQKFIKNAQNSKLFNFLFGAFLKIANTVNSNAVVDLGKCALNTIEVYITSVKFPDQPLTKLKENVTKLDLKDDKAATDGEIAKRTKELETNETTDDQKNNNSEKEIKEIAKSELDAVSIDCEKNSVIMSESGLSDEEKIEFIDDDADDAEETTVAFLEGKFVKRDDKSKTLSSLKEKLKKKVDKLKSKIKKFAGKLKDKFSKAMDALKEKLASLGEKIKKLLDKPIVKTLIFFVECTLPNIVELIAGASKGFATLFSGFQLISLIKNGPKFVKMILDGFKSLRSGFKDKNVQSKYINYGKGSATLIMVIVLSALGMSA
jgi:hypothetical protein